jgi:uncharacterized membrane protein (Fun14 family)
MSELASRATAFLLPLLPSFAVGFILGRVARGAMRKAILLGVVILLVLYVAGRFGVDTTTAESWVESGSSWLGSQLEGVAEYAAAFLPAAGAAAVGMKMGYGRRRAIG